MLEFYYRVYVIYFIIFINMGWVIEGKLYSDYIYVVGKCFVGKWKLFWISGNVSV